VLLLQEITPASADVKRGGKLAIANFVTLFTVSWKHLLADEYLSHTQVTFLLDPKKQGAFFHYFL